MTILSAVSGHQTCVLMQDVANQILSLKQESVLSPVVVLKMVTTSHVMAVSTMPLALTESCMKSVHALQI